MRDDESHSQRGLAMMPKWSYVDDVKLVKSQLGDRGKYIQSSPISQQYIQSSPVSQQELSNT